MKSISESSRNELGRQSIQGGWINTAWVLGLCAALAGCGGGGEESSTSSTPSSPSTSPSTSTPTPPTLASVNVERAISNLLRSTRSFQLVGTAPTAASGSATGAGSPAVGLEANLSVAPSGLGTHREVSYDIVNVTTTLRRAGVTSGTGVMALWLQRNSVTPRMVFQSADRSCGLVSSAPTLPLSAAVGQGGLFYTATRYISCTRPTDPSVFSADGGVTVTWSLEADAGVTWLCLNSTTTYSIQPSSSESDCVEVMSADGEIGSRARVSLRDSRGQTTVLTSR